MKKKKEVLKVESISRGQNLYTDWTVVRVENSAPLFIKDPDETIYKKLIADPKKVEAILKALGKKVKVGNPGTEKPKKYVPKPAKK